ncbi:hypothetical protein BX600DRAFT_446377 [Xylariales sp. PMI_506]|nr:hypothetical protein BX600DRAFT_446377 [Xylariales sp. PMI_506]
MPKKRHYSRYSKPPTTAPPSLQITASASSSDSQHDRTVNNLLADLRRTSLSPNATQSITPFIAPSVPPDLQRILQLPETPAPAPRVRRAIRGGQRLPPGPPPPRSWLSLSNSIHAPLSRFADTELRRAVHWPLPGAFIPDHGSFIDILLRRIAATWQTQKQLERFYLYTLPSRVRCALLYYLTKSCQPGVTITDLELILSGPADSEFVEYGLDKPDIGGLNKDIVDLDLSYSIGQTVSLKSLSDLLFPADAPAEDEVQDSWDAPELLRGPSSLLPGLTRLSLAIAPGYAQAAPWRQLLSLSTKLSTLTHLNLSFWPTPSTTPNALFAKVVSPVTGRATSYGGTNLYSHALDDDWSEAISILKRLSKALYSLEYLDLTGCADWSPALWKEADGDFTTVLVDWVGDWGKVTTLRLGAGVVSDLDSAPDISRHLECKRAALRLERHIREQRAGRGRFISVDADEVVDENGVSYKLKAPDPLSKLNSLA